MQTVLVLTSTFPRSSEDTIPRFVLDVCKELTAEYQVVVIAPHSPGAAREEVIEGVQIHRVQYLPEQFETLIGEGGILPRIRQNSWRIIQIPFLLISQLWALIRYARRYKPDIIHGHWVFYPGFLLWIYSLFSSTPYILTSHGSDLNVLKSRIFRLLARKSLTSASAVTTVSQDLAGTAQSLGAQSVQVIPMGIDQQFHHIQRSQVNTTQIVSVGRLDTHKGFQYMIEAMQHLPREYTYQIIGEGSDRAYLEDVIKWLDLTERVTLLGSKTLTEIQQCYQTAGVFVLPSKTEGFGISVIEAMAAGVPVVVNTIPTLDAHIQHGRGEAIDCTDSEAFAKAVMRASSQPIKQIQTAKAYAEQFSWTQIGRQLRKLYRAVI